MASQLTALLQCLCRSFLRAVFARHTTEAMCVRPVTLVLGIGGEGEREGWGGEGGRRRRRERMGRRQVAAKVEAGAERET
jgi:hypothetical protein